MGLVYVPKVHQVHSHLGTFAADVLSASRSALPHDTHFQLLPRPPYLNLAPR